MPDENADSQLDNQQANENIPVLSNQQGASDISMRNLVVDGLEDTLAPAAQYTAEVVAESPVELLPNLMPQPDTIPPVSNGSFQPSNPLPSTRSPFPERKSHKKLIVIALVVLFIVTLFMGAGAAAYNFWYQNPDKVVADAILNLVRAKSVSLAGEVSQSSDENGLKVTFNGSGTKNYGLADTTITLSDGDETREVGVGLTVDTKGEIYIKVKNTDFFIERYSGSATSTDPEVAADGLPLDTLIRKLNDKWVHVTLDDIDKSGKLSKQRDCIITTLDKFSQNESMSSEVAAVYEKYPFVKINKELGSMRIADSDSLGYILIIDENMSEKFDKEVMNTTFAKETKACSDNSGEEAVLNADNYLPDYNRDTEVTIWVNKWTHELTQFSMSAKRPGGNNYALSLNPTFNQDIVVEAPKSFIELKDVIAEYDEAVVEPDYLNDVTYLDAKELDMGTNANDIVKITKIYYAMYAEYPTLVQLKNLSNPEIKMSEELQAMLGSTAPSAAQNSIIQYKYCSKNGASVYYYDNLSSTVKKLVAGTC